MVKGFQSSPKQGCLETKWRENDGSTNRGEDSELRSPITPQVCKNEVSPRTGLSPFKKARNERCSQPKLGLLRFLDSSKEVKYFV